MSRAKLVLLVIGIPNVGPDRADSSSAVVVDGRSYIADCGAGIKQRAGRAFVDGHDALRSGKIDNFFIIHLHPAHTNGLSEFVGSGWIFDRCGSLRVHCQKGVGRLVHRLVELYKPEMFGHLNNSSFYLTELEIETADISSGIVYCDDFVEEEAFSAPHGTLERYAYKFKRPDKAIAFPAATCPSPKMVEKPKGCDILLSEVYSEAGLKGRRESWSACIKRVQTSSGKLGRIAMEV